MANKSSLRRLLGWSLIVLLLVVAVGAWFALDPGFRLARLTKSGVDVPQNEFERRIRAYLLDHPEVIIESMNRLEARQAVQQGAELQAVLKARAEEVFRDADTPVGGNPNGDVSLVEFFDYNCPYCRQMAPVMIQVEAADAQLRVVFKEFPILGPNSVFAAKAALAAHKQGKYVAFHQALMQVRTATDATRVLEVANQTGLNVERLKADMDDPAIRATIEKNLALARALRIEGTPGFVIGDQILRGATDLQTLQAWIRDARARRQ
jgi:protein-disulfide isomerase